MPQQKKPAAGAPAQGAGGKAAGTAAPPSKPKQQQVQPKPKPLQAQPQAKQPQKLPPAGAPAQGAAGKGQAAAPGAPKAKPLTPQQTKQLAAAQAGGTEAQYLANHPGVAKHQQKIGAPAPGAPPFVSVGDQVTDGTVCIIEAMKTMNPVPAPAAGRIVEIFVRDGQPVEFGEPLMIIE